ncbi:hypothetical protein ACFV2X_25440 [Streptomyces sp. NPDC059679]|uniref:hypothetical protein n=1 Tax=Streptomyces sp. NPDC059679 TaxID=3346903 RepID=UPI00369F0509
MGRAGRPQGAPRGATEQANALANFLRQLTDGITVRELGRRYKMSKTSWSEYRSGTKVIPWHRLQQVIKDYIRDDGTRQRALATAERLHREAIAAENSRRPQPAPSQQTSAQARAEADLKTSATLVQALERIVATLQAQLPTAQESEAGQDHQTATQGTARTPEHTRQHLRKAQERLDRVRQVHAAAQEAATAASMPPAAQDRPGDAAHQPDGDAPRTSALLPAPRPQLDILLAQVHNDLQEQHRQVARLWEQVAPPGPVLVRGEVLDRADNPSTSTATGTATTLAPPAAGCAQAWSP